MALGIFRDIFIYEKSVNHADPDSPEIRWTMYTNCELLRNIGKYNSGRCFIAISLQNGILNFDEDSLHRLE